LSSSVVLDELGTYYSKSHFSKTFGSKGLQVLGFQIRDLMVHNIVAFHGKMVSNSYGLSEPWKFWPQKPYINSYGFLVVWIGVW